MAHTHASVRTKGLGMRRCSCLAASPGVFVLLKLLVDSSLLVLFLLSFLLFFSPFVCACTFDLVFICLPQTLVSIAAKTLTHPRLRLEFWEKVRLCLSCFAMYSVGTVC